MASLHYAYGCMVVLEANTGVTMLVSYDIPNEGAEGNIIHTHALVPSYSSFYLLAYDWKLATLCSKASLPGVQY